MACGENKYKKASGIFTISNKLGLHARAASKFVRMANKFKSDIYVSKNDYEVNGKSIMGVLTLAATKGTSITIRAEGDDAEDAVAELGDLIDNKFGEEE